MERSTLGRTGLEVSRIGFGCEPLGGTDWGIIDERKAMRAVGQALEVGINVFDTADVYGLGRSEERLAQALGKHRHDVVVVTKFGVGWRQDAAGGRAETFRDIRPSRIAACLEGSLRRLRLEVIPVFLVHWPDGSTPLEPVLEELCRLRDQGKIRHFGLSNFAADVVDAAAARFDIGVVEAEYNLLRHTRRQPMLEASCAHNLGFIAYGALAQGLLSGKYDASSTFGSGDRRSRLAQFSGSDFHVGLSVASRVRDVAVSRNRPTSQVALRWVLDDPRVATVVVGAKNAEQVVENAGAAGWYLSAEEREQISGVRLEAG